VLLKEPDDLNATFFREGVFRSVHHFIFTPVNKFSCFFNPSDRQKDQENPLKLSNNNDCCCA
jgi:hypothetical protein